MAKIIQIAGTNASGKTTAMRRVIARATSSTAIHEEGRKRPVGYDLTFPSVEGVVRVIGPYAEDLPTGGVDAYGGATEAFYDLVYDLWAQGYSVLFEGIRAMNHTRGIELENKTHSMHVFLLSTPLDEVMLSLQARREAAGNKRELKSPKDIESNVTRARNYATKIYEVGGKKYICTRDEAPDKVLSILQG